MEQKIRYEKPVSMPLGAVAPIAGVSLCPPGTDPNVGPICTPGNLATYFCSLGTTNTTGNCDSGGTASGRCKTGSYPD